MIIPRYKAQVDLLLDVVPFVAKEKCFALKGGTAINMFVWDMPRLSVDIDLTYIRFDNRNTALATISEALQRVQADITQNLPAIQVKPSGITPGKCDKLLCTRNGVGIKIEVNTTMRGIANPVALKQTASSVRREFEKFAAIQAISTPELFGGKICAALDRQHPRDLFDIHQLFQNGGITEEIKEGFIAALLSHSRPIQEMLKPNFQNQKETFATQFEGMALQAFSYEDFEAARERLVMEINGMLSDNDRKLLLGFKAGEPDWGLSSMAVLKDLPAVKWKLQNIRKLQNQDPQKHSVTLQQLERLLLS